MNILISGKNSYIGTNLKKFLENYGHSVDELDTTDSSWETFDYSCYDAVVHVAAIVHENSRKANAEIFEKVNTVLPFEIAKLSKLSGVKHFVFLSSMAVYGQDKKLPFGNVIDKNTNINPVSMYGKSKYNAEKKLSTLISDDFYISFVRPPNVYGKGCRGNYMNVFKAITVRLPFFPYVYNGSKQSVVYIDNLSNLIRLIIESNTMGIYTPQDDLAPSTNDLVYAISLALGINKRFSKILGCFVRPFKYLKIVNKLYGGVSYDYDMSSHFDGKYRIVSFYEGIKKTFED